MVAEEIQTQLDELDTRLDRLRATYEQYFIGFEKIEPLVQRKEVERRIQQLRKQQIRNTALRFRFQMIVQRYTTYLTYWQRICRQIEEGTLKRDMLKAQRYGRDKARAQTPGANEVEPPDELSAGLTVPLDGLDAPDELPRAPVARTVPGLTESIPPLPFDAHDGPPSLVPPRAPAPPVSGVRPPPLPPGHANEAPLARTASAGSGANAGRRPVLSPFGASRASVPPPGSRIGSTPPPPIAGAAVFTPKPPTVGVPAATRPASVPLPPAVRPPTVAVPAAPKPQPPVVRPPTVATPAAPKPQPAAPRDEALHALYERYRDARRKNGENDVAFETVAKQVRETMPKLEEKYRGQQVELDVIVKDGRTILRPVVRPKKK